MKAQTLTTCQHCGDSPRFFEDGGWTHPVGGNRDLKVNGGDTAYACHACYMAVLTGKVSGFEVHR